VLYGNESVVDIAMTSLLYPSVICNNGWNQS